MANSVSTNGCCRPQKFGPSLSSLPFQAIFVVQPAENRRRFDAVTRGHGFRNTGTSVAMAFEVFIRHGAPAAQNSNRTDAEREALALAFAFAGTTLPAPLDGTKKKD